MNNYFDFLGVDRIDSEEYLSFLGKLSNEEYHCKSSVVCDICLRPLDVDRADTIVAAKQFGFEVDLHA